MAYYIIKKIKDITLSFFSYLKIGDPMKKMIFTCFLIICFWTNAKAIDTSARSAILMDQDSKRILYAKNIHSKQSVASISKIMTAYLSVTSGKLKETVTIGKEIEGAYGSAVYIQKGEKLTLEDLTYALMLRSGNDASLSIAKKVGGKEETFIEMMNKKAKILGMKNTTFENPNGLDNNSEGNQSTAYDMALLTSKAMQNKDYKKIVGTKKYTLKTNKNNYVWHNKHRLLTSYKYATGGKTGFTEKARRTLVTTGTKDNLNLVVVTLNDGNDFEDHKELLEYGFENYKNYLILKEGIFEVLEDSYYKDYDLYIKKDFTYPLTDSEKNNIILNIEMEKQRKFKRDSKVGEIIISLNDKEIGRENIYIKDLKKKTGVWEKIKEWFHDK